MEKWDEFWYAIDRMHHNEVHYGSKKAIFSFYQGRNMFIADYCTLFEMNALKQLDDVRLPSDLEKKLNADLERLETM